MKFVLILFLTTIVLANENGCFNIETEIDLQYASRGTITLTLINDWPQTEQLLGLDFTGDADDSCILTPNNKESMIKAYSPTTGALTGIQMPLAEQNANCFGVTCNSISGKTKICTTDWYEIDLFCSEDSGTTWITSVNPALSKAKGIDYDGTQYWETTYSYSAGASLWRFNIGAEQTQIKISEVNGNTAGVAVFQYEKNTVIALTCYTSFNIYFYQWDNSKLTYLGSAPCPADDVYNSLGLTYSPVSKNMYWSYQDTQKGYHLIEFSFDFQQALAPSSWGAIKASF